MTKLIDVELSTKSSEENQPPHEHQQWLKCGFTFRVQCHFNKIFAVWRQSEDGPIILGKFTVIDVSSDSENGFCISLETDILGVEQTVQVVSHSPCKLFGLPIFAHIPHISEVTFTPHHRVAHNILRVPIVFKTSSNPYKNLKDGDIYVTQVGEFRNTNLQYADLKL